jgi:hypothetical protein
LLESICSIFRKKKLIQSMAGIIYLLQECDGDLITHRYKIGKTTTTSEKRKSQYQAGNSREMRVYHEVYVEGDHSTVETFLHQHYAAYHLSQGGGVEWFQFFDDVLPNVVASMNYYGDEYEEDDSYSYTPSFEYPNSYSGGYSYSGSDLPWGWIMGGVAAVAVVGVFATNAGVNRECVRPVGCAIRDQPSLSGQEIMRIHQGEVVKAGRENNGWFPVKVASKQGYIANDVVAQTDRKTPEELVSSKVEGPNAVPEAPSSATAQANQGVSLECVNPNGCPVFPSQSTTAKSQEKITANYPFGGEDMGNGWYRVTSKSGTIGYVSGKFVKVKRILP